MKALLKKHASKLRFGLVGGINTGIDFGILFVLHGLGVNTYLANIISTSVAFVFSFFANRSFTFRSSGSLRRQIIPFLVVTLIGLWVLQPAIIYLVQIPLTSLDAALSLFIAKLIATIGTMIWNYLLYKRFVFPPEKTGE